MMPTQHAFHAAKQKPAIYAIKTAKSEFNIARFAGFDRSFQCCNYFRKSVVINGVRQSPVLQFVTWLAKIFQCLIIDEFNFATCRQSTNKGGHTVNDQTKVLFTGSEPVFSAFSVLYIGGSAVPSNDVSLLIHQRLGTADKPAIFSVKPPNAGFAFGGFL